MEVDACLACGTPFGRGFETPGEGPSISPRSAIRWSLLYPGLGHFRAGRGIDGLARAVVFTWPLLTGIAFLSLRPKGGFGAVGMLGTAFVLCAALFYAVAALDAGRAANGDDPLVSSRMLLWIAAVLVLSSVVSAAVIAGQGITTLRNR